MYGRIHSNLAVDLYLSLDEFEDISTGLEKVLSCELPKLDGSYSGKKAHLQCKDLKEYFDLIKVEHKEGNYFVEIDRHIPEPTNGKGHFGQTDCVSVTLYIFEIK